MPGAFFIHEFIPVLLGSPSFKIRCSCTGRFHWYCALILQLLLHGNIFSINSWTSFLQFAALLTSTPEISPLPRRWISPIARFCPSWGTPRSERNLSNVSRELRVFLSRGSPPKSGVKVTSNPSGRYLTCPNTPPVGIPLRKNDEKTTITKALHSVDMRAFVGTKLSHARNFRLV
jgi:hypothetical protein